MALPDPDVPGEPAPPNLRHMRTSDRVGGWYLRTSAKVAVGMLLLLVVIFLVALLLN